MVQINARPNETVEQLLERFKQKVNNSGILSDYKKHERFEKPSVKRKRKQLAAKKRMLKNMKKRRVKPKKRNWKWNRNRTKQIPMFTGPRPKRFENKDRSRYSKKDVNTKNKPLTKEQIDRALKKGNVRWNNSQKRR